MKKSKGEGAKGWKESTVRCVGRGRDVVGVLDGQQARFLRATDRCQTKQNDDWCMSELLWNCSKLLEELIKTFVDGEGRG
jgi:hypothetical protein